MENVIRGKAFVVGDNIDTDQIIPAEFLSYDPSNVDERKFFGRYALSGVPLEQSGLPTGNVPFVKEGEFASDFRIIIGGTNFGCGSSREHAPLAIAEAGGQAVVAQSYARIFYRNSVNGGYVVPVETDERLVDEISTGDELELDIEAHELRDKTTGKTFAIKGLGDVGEIIAAGGVFEYAKKTGMLK
jgi:3-isopropylmalate/(R)-2-methylmalate dehydratase small subunit